MDHCRRCTILATLFVAGCFTPTNTVSVSGTGSESGSSGVGDGLSGMTGPGGSAGPGGTSAGPTGPSSETEPGSADASDGGTTTGTGSGSTTESGAQNCTPAEMSCAGDDLIVCSDEGTLDPPVTCEFGCQEDVPMGTAACNECSPGTTECLSDSDLGFCDAAGVFQPQACEYGCNSDIAPADCYVCPPGGDLCSADLTHTQGCNAAGTGFNSSLNCVLVFGVNCDPSTGLCLMP